MFGRLDCCCCLPTPTDLSPPEVVSVSINSTNGNRAKAGDTVTVYLTLSEPVSVANCSILDTAVPALTGSGEIACFSASEPRVTRLTHLLWSRHRTDHTGQSWQASVAIASGHTQGNVIFACSSVADRAGNVLATLPIASTTDGTQVLVGKCVAVVPLANL